MDELRSKHKSIQSAAHQIALECLHPQSAHGSPYHVHPYPSPVRLQHAFQNSPRIFQPKGLKTHFDSRAYSTPRDSPLPGRAAHLSDRFSEALTLTPDTDALLARIAALFPTVSDTHIKILLKKYYNREAVVISALQVEKHPMVASPAAGRLQRGAAGVCSALQFARAASAHCTPLSGTPQGSPSWRRPASGASSCYATTRSVDSQPLKHSNSPKMKLKYLKSIFPKAEETLILDVLANKDNNVQKASEELLTMGFPKKETLMQPPKKPETPAPPKKVVTIAKTAEEKNELVQKLQRKYSSVAPRVVALALESVHYQEARAERMLDAVRDEPRRAPPAPAAPPAAPPAPAPASDDCHSRRASPEPPPPPPAARRLKAWPDHLKPILKCGVSAEGRFKSHYRTAARGPDAALRRGPQDTLLLEDYMAWNGPNPDLRSGQGGAAEGPAGLDEGPGGRGEGRGSRARGPAGLARGPAGLARGSLYQKIKKTAKIAA